VTLDEGIALPPLPLPIPYRSGDLVRLILAG
jgi:hypothetical protein